MVEFRITWVLMGISFILSTRQLRLRRWIVIARRTNAVLPDAKFPNTERKRMIGNIAPRYETIGYIS